MSMIPSMITSSSSCKWYRSHQNLPFLLPVTKASIVTFIRNIMLKSDYYYFLTYRMARPAGIWSKLGGVSDIAVVFGRQVQSIELPPTVDPLICIFHLYFYYNFDL